jgi:lysophospholipase L1-like esterase
MRIGFFGDSLTEGVPGVSFLEALAVMLPEHDLENLGKRGDTVISLHRRVAQGRHPGSLDVAVLWIGVNDTLAKISFGHGLLKRLMRQPQARSLTEFREHYRRTVERLLKNARRVLTVSPLLIGEDLSNPWNRELCDVSEVIASVAASYDAVEFIDLREEIAPTLAAGRSSDYLPKRVSRVACDVLRLRTPGAVDAAASRRGLKLTLDGVHLNSAGAAVVADSIRRALASPLSAHWRRDRERSTTPLRCRL